MRLFLHDEDCRPLGIVTLNWDIEKRGPLVHIPIYPKMRAASYSGTEVASRVQTMDAHIMEIRLSPIRCEKRDGSVSEGWIGMTSTPDLCETFFEIEFDAAMT